MYIKFTNNTNAEVSIKGLQVVRAYFMWGLGQQNDCSEDETQDGTYDFAPRQDYPCNYEKCGGMSYTGFTHDNTYFQQVVNGNQPYGTILSRGIPYSWHWTNPLATFSGFNNNTNYVAKAHCLFNFNNVGLCDDNGIEIINPNDSRLQDGSVHDIPFLISLDNSHWFTCHHGKSIHHMAHSIDLATHEFLKDYYNDEPGAENTLYLLIPNNPDPGVNFFLPDGETGLVNLYRVYQTKPCCPTISSSVQGGGSVSPAGGPFSVPQQGKRFDMYQAAGSYLTDVQIDGISKNAITPYTAQWSDLNLGGLGMEGHSIRGYFAHQNIIPPHCNIPHTDYNDHTNHSDTTHQNFENHANSYGDWGYFDQEQYYHDDYPYQNFNNHIDSVHTNFSDHNDVAGEYWEYFDQEQYYHGDVPHVNFNNHADSNFWDHANSYGDWGYFDQEQYYHEDIPHQNFDNHSDVTFADWTNYNDTPHCDEF